jgi:hypothetical protein
LAAGARITHGARGVGGVREGLEDGDARRYRELRGQPGHRVRHRAQGHAPLRLGDSATQHAGGRVQLGGELAGGTLELTDPHRLEPIRIAGEVAVHAAPILEGKARRLSDQDRRLPLADAALAQRPTGAGHLVGEDPREPDVLTTAVR